MARKIYYKILDDGNNTVTNSEWDEITKLQHWYNSEFIWTAGKINFKMFAVFPNVEEKHGDEEKLWQTIVERRAILRKEGLSENEIVRQLESENLIIVKKGGYFDNCLASGFTRVAGNELNAYLVCEFLIKASRIAPRATFTVRDEGKFIKPERIIIRNNQLTLIVESLSKESFYQTMVKNKRVFSVVDPMKYDNYPLYQPTVENFNNMKNEEQQNVLNDWNWLGFENNFDINGDDIQGYDLNKKVSSFDVELLVKQL
jgi:hypothetical protein